MLSIIMNEWQMSRFELGITWSAVSFSQYYTNIWMYPRFHNVCVCIDLFIYQLIDKWMHFWSILASAGKHYPSRYRYGKGGSGGGRYLPLLSHAQTCPTWALSQWVGNCLWPNEVSSGQKSSVVKDGAWSTLNWHCSSHRWWVECNKAFCLGHGKESLGSSSKSFTERLW